MVPPEVRHNEKEAADFPGQDMNKWELPQRS